MKSGSETETEKMKNIQLKTCETASDVSKLIAAHVDASKSSVVGTDVTDGVPFKPNSAPDSTDKHLQSNAGSSERVQVTTSSAIQPTSGQIISSGQKLSSGLVSSSGQITSSKQTSSGQITSSGKTPSGQSSSTGHSSTTIKIRDSSNLQSSSSQFKSSSSHVKSSSGEIRTLNRSTSLNSSVKTPSSSVKTHTGVTSSSVSAKKVNPAKPSTLHSEIVVSLSDSDTEAPLKDKVREALKMMKKKKKKYSDLKSKVVTISPVRSDSSVIVIDDSD